MNSLQQKFLSGMLRMAPATISRWVPLTRKLQGRSFIFGYHSVTNKPSIVIPFILKHGFIPSMHAEKGWGVSFANSSAYCALQSGEAPVLICGIDPEENLIQRYRADISDGTTDSEYFVADPRLIHPLFLTRFDITIPTRSRIHPHYDCPDCSYNDYGNCHCPQKPTILPEDIITLD